MPTPVASASTATSGRAESFLPRRIAPPLTRKRLSGGGTGARAAEGSPSRSPDRPELTPSQAARSPRVWPAQPRRRRPRRCPRARPNGSRDRAERLANRGARHTAAGRSARDPPRRASQERPLLANEERRVAVAQPLARLRERKAEFADPPEGGSLVHPLETTLAP